MKAVEPGGADTMAGGPAGGCIGHPVGAGPVWLSICIFTRFVLDF